MKLGLCLGAAAAAVLSASAASAQSAQGLELGLQTYSYDYKESFEGESIQDEGRFTGFTVDYGRPVGGFSFDVRFRYAQGEIDYSASDGARLDDVEQASGQLELLLGRPFQASSAVTVTPYVGIGSRALLDFSGGRVTDTGLEGYDREVGYAYLPLGAAVRADLGNGRALSGHAQVNLAVSGEVQSNFSEIERGAPDIEAELDGGHGFELAAAFSAPVGRVRIGFGPFLRMWDIDQSESVFLSDPDIGEIELFEPPNETVELGFRLTVGF